MDIDLLRHERFDEYVISVLKQICINQNKPVYFRNEIRGLVHSADENISKIAKRIRDILGSIDGFLPLGINNISKPTIINIKYNQNGLLNDISKYKDLEDVVLLYIVKDLKMDKSIIPNENIVIWDINASWNDKYALDYYSIIDELDPLYDETVFNRKNESNLRLLRSEIENKNISLSLGAGISVEYGVDKLEGLIDHAFNYLKEEGKIDSIEEIQQKIGDTSIINGQFIKNKLGINFMEYIYNSLYRRNVKPPDSTLKALLPLIKKLKDNRKFNIITYNYDDNLEMELKKDNLPVNIIFNENISSNDDINIYHPHGYLPRTAKDDLKVYEEYMIFTENDYHKLYNQPYSWSMSLQDYLYRDNTYLFIGCSITDPNLRRILKVTNRLGKVHYAFMRRGDLSLKDVYMIHKHFRYIGVECIWVKDYKELKKILLSL